jgi:hypothetical protein
MNVDNTQRRFAVMGNNTFTIANRLMTDQKICRLLKYPTKDPFKSIDPITGNKQPDVDGIDLIHKQILIVPKVFDDSTEKMSYIVSVFDDFTVNQLNPEFKVSTVRFDIACPYDEWILNEQSLRPYLIMERIDQLFNGQPLAGIGNLQFYRADNLTLSPWIGGYSMRYKINEFN